MQTNLKNEQLEDVVGGYVDEVYDDFFIATRETFMEIMTNYCSISNIHNLHDFQSNFTRIRWELKDNKQYKFSFQYKGDNIRYFCPNTLIYEEYVE